MEKIKNVRNYSFDLLRVMCMLMIICLHFGSHGGLLSYFPESSAMSYIMITIRDLCICAVNVFVLISGFFMIDKSTINVKRILSIIIEIIFYAWLYLILGLIFNAPSLDFKGIVTSAFPISYKLYWFPTCYVFLCVLSPFLNQLLRHLSQKTYVALLLILFIAFSLSNEILVLSDPFNVVDGYSIIWFVFLYCFAGYFKIYGIKSTFTKKKCLMAYLVSVVVMCMADVVILALSSKIALIDRYNLYYHFSRYCSVLVLIESISLFMLFQQVRLENKFVIKLISFFAPLTFGVYLIHDNENVRNYLYYSVLKLNTVPTNVSALPIILGFVLLVFVVASLIEWLRQIIFVFLARRLKCGDLADKLQTQINLLFNDFSRNGD